MSERKHCDVDVIKELRLRRWARDHYVAEESRSATWHPIVLDEMLCKDAEVAVETDRIQQLGQSAYVPLEPSIQHIRHPAHANYVPPRTVHDPVESESRIQI